MHKAPLLLLLLALAAASCARQTPTGNRGSDAAPPHAPLSALRPVPQQADSVMINAGTLPLVHLFDQGGRVRVVDETTKRTLLSASVPAGSIISISESGILIARERRLTTSLDPAHRYEIWWDTSSSR